MIVTKGNENAFVFTTNIEFENPKGGTDFVVLREFNTSESHVVMTSAKINKNGEIDDIPAMIEKSEKFFADCIVDHSFEYEDGTKLSGRQVYDLLKKSNQLFQEIMTVWLNSNKKGRLIQKAEGGNPLA